MNEVNRSRIITFSQILLMLFIFLSGQIVPKGTFLLLIFLAGIFLGVWAAYSFRGSRFNIFPAVRKGASLVTSGPYQYIRHPMYSAIILICFALVATNPTMDRIIALALLMLVLIYKTSIEEVYLHNHFKEYGSYVKRTKKLIPILY